MPRRSRIDAPGALHHIIVRGIEIKSIFKDDAARDIFLERLKNKLLKNKLSTYQGTSRTSRNPNTVGSNDTVIILIELLLYFDKRATIFPKSGVPLISRPLA